MCWAFGTAASWESTTATCSSHAALVMWPAKNASSTRSRRCLSSPRLRRTAKTPRPGQSALIAGLSALDDELDWFEAHAQGRSLDLGAELHPACQRYVDFLIAAGYSEPFQVLLALFYVVEVAYTVAWGRLEVRGPYAEFIARWTHEDFQAYVRVLSRLVDEHPHPRQQAMFIRK